jgi:hypothetical protein
MSNLVKYIARQSSTHTVHLLDGVFTANNGLLELEPKYADELDRLINTGKRPDLLQAFAKVDDAAAKAFVAQYKQEHGMAAVTGPMHSHATAEHQARQQNVASVLATTTKGPNIPPMPPSTGGITTAEQRNESTNILSLAPADENGQPAAPPPGTQHTDPKVATENKNPLGNLLKPKA